MLLGSITTLSDSCGNYTTWEFRCLLVDRAQTELYDIGAVLHERRRRHATAASPALCRGREGIPLPGSPEVDDLNLPCARVLDAVAGSAGAPVPERQHALARSTIHSFCACIFQNPYPLGLTTTTVAARTRISWNRCCSGRHFLFCPRTARPPSAAFRVRWGPAPAQ